MEVKSAVAMVKMSRRDGSGVGMTEANFQMAEMACLSHGRHTIYMHACQPENHKMVCSRIQWVMLDHGHSFEPDFHVCFVQ